MAPPTRRLQHDEQILRDVQRAQAEILEKDETELQLEKMLFGDEAGFMGSLRTSGLPRDTALVRANQSEGGGDSDVDGSREDEEMDDVADEELFFLDAGMGELPSAVSYELKEDVTQMEEQTRQPAWVDNDDDRLTVSLATNTRLRKLRDTEDDDVVTGTEYVRRLRRQYERLHPTPEWAKYAYKKRRTVADEVASDSGSDVSLDEELSLSSTQPLSDLLRSAESLTRIDPDSSRGQLSRRLRPGVLDIQRLKDVTGAGPSSVDAMQFHPSFPLILTAGPSSTINLYHISPQPPNPNPLLSSLHLKSTPLHTAAFCCPIRGPSDSMDESQDGTRIILSSRRRYFHTWSLSTGTVQKVSRPVFGDGRSDQKTMESFKVSPCGRYMGLIGSGRKGGGTINVLSTETMQWTCACRIDSRGGVADFSWWGSGRGFAVVGKNGEVSEYDVEAKRVVCRWLDEGAVGTTVIALGGQSDRPGLGGDRWAAVGSSSGIVNIYDRRDWTGLDGELKVTQNPKPARVFDQLTTPTSHLNFSADGQMMVMSSRWKKNALRLVHLPSCAVYQNWPTDKTPLGRVSSVALSMDGGYLAVANEQGRIRLFQIRD